MVEMSPERSRILASVIASLPPKQRIKTQAMLNISPNAEKYEELLISSFGKRNNA
jgi:hypothetical protein